MLRPCWPTTRADIIDADLRRPHAVLGAGGSQKLLDFDRPVALLAIAALHYVGHDDNIERIMRRYVSALCPGSIVAISHLTSDGSPDRVAAAQAQWNDTVADVMTMRSHDEIAALLEATGLELVNPGLVWGSQWRPDPAAPADPYPPERSGHWVAVGTVPA